jgi:hypothetical protein
VEKLSKRARVPITRIGTCVHGRRVRVIDSAGKSISIGGLGGHDHFKKNLIQQNTR